MEDGHGRVVGVEDVAEVGVGVTAVGTTCTPMRAPTSTTSPSRTPIRVEVDHVLDWRSRQRSPHEPGRARR